MPRVIVATRRGLSVNATHEALASARDAFATSHIARLRGFLGDDLLELFRIHLPRAEFRRRIEDGVEIEHTLEDPSLIGLALITLNDPALFEVIDRISGCGSIGCFTGRVHRRHASANGHYYPWHTDASQQRLVGLTVNLSERPFDGGVLQIRKRRSKEIVAQAGTPPRGDALLFRISKDLEHHVTPVTTESPRLVLAGWFRRSPDFWTKARACESS